MNQAAAALISNPMSYTNRRRGPQALQRLEAQIAEAGGCHWQARDGAALDQAVNQALAAGCGLIVANGGDGTIHGVVSEVLRHQRNDVVVAVLPGGRTNVIAADLGMRGSSERLLQYVLAHWQNSAYQVERATLDVRAEGEVARYGFLVNGAGLAHFIENCWQFRERYRGLGLYGGFGTGVWVVGRLCAALAGSRLFVPRAARLYWQAEEGEQQHWCDSLAAFSLTTNKHLPLGISPYATDDVSGQGRKQDQQCFKATAIAGTAQGIGRRIISGLIGKGRSFSGADGFISGLPKRVQIHAVEPFHYHLDGESYALASGQNLTVTRGPGLRLFHRPG